MGHDLYIQARIREKRTGRVISRGDSDDYAAEDDISFFDICWWCGSPECDVRIKMIEICSSHGGTGYTDSDLFIPIPPSALRAVYAHVVNCRVCVGDLNGYYLVDYCAASFPQFMQIMELYQKAVHTIPYPEEADWEEYEECCERAEQVLRQQVLEIDPTAIADVEGFWSNVIEEFGAGCK